MQVDLPKGGHAKNMLKNDEVGVHGGWWSSMSPRGFCKWAELKKNLNNKGENKHASEKSSQTIIKVSHWQNNQPERRPRATYWRPSDLISTN